MKFVVERTVDGISKFEVVVADSPTEAMHRDCFSSFLGSGERAHEIENSDVAIVGIYEIGQVNHLAAINDRMETSSWSNRKISELESELKKFKGESE